MTRIRDWVLAALAVFVLSIDGWGCAAGGADGPPRYVLVDAPASPATVTPEGVWFAEDSPLYAAQAAWGKAAPSEPVFQVLPEPEVSAACNNNDAALPAPEGEHTITIGCTMFLETPVRILVTEGLNAPVTEATKLHELGHFLFGRPNHIQSAKCSMKNTQSAYVMCAAGAPYSYPTPQDVDWALFGENPSDDPEEAP